MTRSESEARSDSQAASDSEAASRVGPGPYGPLCIYGWGAGGLLPEAGVKRQEGRDGGCRRGIARRAGVDWRRRAALQQQRVCVYSGGRRPRSAGCAAEG